MIYCFRSFHTEKNVISVSHEKNGNLSGLKLINGGEVKKSFSFLFLPSHRQKFIFAPHQFEFTFKCFRKTLRSSSFSSMRFVICTRFFFLFGLLFISTHNIEKCFVRKFVPCYIMEEKTQERELFYPCHFYIRCCLHMGKQTMGANEVF
jgi:hypothetical protein